MGRFTLRGAAAWLGIAAAACLSGVVHAEIIARDIYYTRYSTFDVSESNVKKVRAVYDRTNGSFTMEAYQNIARTPGADGIVFAPDGELLIGGQNEGAVYKVKTDGTFVGQTSNIAQAFHLTVDPDRQRVWTCGLPGGLAELPLAPFGPGVPRPVSGPTTSITQIEAVPNGSGGYKWFYTASGPEGFGVFGTFDINTFTTTPVFTNFEAAHGMRYDPFSGHVILSGESQIVQIDPNTNPPSVIAVLDLTAMDANMDLDQIAVDGQGLIYGASNNGQLVLVDYAATGRVDTATRVRITFLDTFLDDIAPLIGGGSAPCCPIGTGDFDGRAGQISQLPFTNASSFDFRVADDFYLPPGDMYRVRTIEGTMITSLTDPILRKAGIELYEECNGQPGQLISFAPLNPANPSGPTEPVITLTPTGQTFNGQAIVKVTATFNNLWLRGGKNYWVSFFGKSDGDLVWSWGTAGNGIIKGKPGLFRSTSNGFPEWTGIETICCGCTDFAFCVTADNCKILYDAGRYALDGSYSLAPANAPLTNPLAAKTADNFVVPPCDPMMVCYLEAYIITNCDAAALDIFTAETCGRPSESDSVVARLTPNRIIHTGQFITRNGQQLEVLCLQFYDMNVTLLGGRNYWLSAYGLQQGALRQQAYFAYNTSCRNPCLIKFDQSYIKGRALSLDTWTAGNLVTGAPHDNAFLVAIKAATRGVDNAGPSTCPVDFDRNGRLNIDDIFTYVAAWFRACP
jgi:hypothetical protein